MIIIFSISIIINYHIFKELNGKEKETLENEAKEKIANRKKTLEKATQVKSQLNL